MKDYPSIPRSTGTRFHEFDAHVFDKLDGNSLRFEWNPVAGWYKAGTRTRLLDPADPRFGPALLRFLTESAEPLAALARRERWSGLVVFAEWWGDHSFAGIQQPADPMHLTVFDLAPLRKGILPPADFRKLVEGLAPTPRFLGRVRWTRGYVERVRRGEVEGITFEGVVGKAPGKQGPLMAKAKTQAWLDRVRALYDPEQAERIINS